MSYLKALGVFRLVAEQADKSARGCWRGGIFVLETTLVRDGLTKFFREQYKPTPIVAPWGGRSGFYPDDSERTAREALGAINGTTEERFRPFREAICVVRQILDRLGIRVKDDVGRRDNKVALMRACANELPDEVLPWLDAVFVLTDDAVKYPPLLGTGGNEGSGSYVSTFSQLVVSLLVKRQTDLAVAAALFASPAPVLADVAVGQFAPGAIDAPNSSVGFDGGGGANPWDYLLALEGTLLFRGAAARRLGTDTGGKAAFPFTVDPNPVGYESAADGEDVRAELWMPEWQQPTGLGEVAHLFAEGRAQLGRRQARSGVDFARAAVTIGVDRGLSAFHRFGIVKRNGLSYFAAHLGRFPVREVPPARLLDQLDPWIAPLRRVIADDRSPPRFAAAVRRLDAAALDLCRYGADAERLQDVLRAAGRIEGELANAPKLRADFSGLHPLAGLSDDWLHACDDGSAEFRLAVSLAFLPGVRNRHRPFRMYVEPVAKVSQSRWMFDDSACGVVWSAADLPSNLAAILGRRLLDTGSGAESPSEHALWCPPRLRPRLADVLAFLDGTTDDRKLSELLWGLSAVSRPNREFQFVHPPRSGASRPPTDYSLLKLVLLDGPASRPTPSGPAAPSPIRNEPRVIGLLRAGRLDEAVDVACRRLQASGFPTYLAGPVAGRAKPVSGFPHDPERTRRLCAALLFPLRKMSIEDLLKLTVRELISPVV
jgi:CRISPR-associated protein Csx17